MEGRKEKSGDEGLQERKGRMKQGEVEMWKQIREGKDWKRRKQRRVGEGSKGVRERKKKGEGKKKGRKKDR